MNMALRLDRRGPPLVRGNTAVAFLSLVCLFVCNQPTIEKMPQPTGRDGSISRMTGAGNFLGAGM